MEKDYTNSKRIFGVSFQYGVIEGVKQKSVDLFAENLDVSSLDRDITERIETFIFQNQILHSRMFLMQLLNKTCISFRNFHF